MSTRCQPELPQHETGAVCLERVHREIRRAANSFLGITELLLESHLTLEQREYVEVLRSATDRLLSVTGRVMRMAGQEPEDAAVCVNFDLRETAEQMASLMTILGAGNGIQVISEVARTGGWPVTGDKRKFEQVVVSVTSALMKSGSPGKIRISVGRDEGENVICEITAPAGKSSIEDAADFASDLSIEVAEQEVRAGGGAFSVARTTEQTIVRCTMRLPDAWNDTNTAQEPELGKPARILLAEDSPDNQFVVRAYIKDHPYALETVYDGIAALDKAKRETYSLILMDIEMPGMSGIEAMKAIREWEANTGRRPTPIVALTAHSGEVAKELISDRGFTAYLAKPVRKQAVLSALQRYTITALS
jgi:CheY-like chemotaxis protein